MRAVSDPLRRRSGRGLIGRTARRSRGSGSSRPAGRRIRGASTIEYALLLALVAAVAAVPLGIAIRDVFGEVAVCIESGGTPPCGQTPPDGGDGGGGGVPTSPTGTGTATVTPSPTPTECISPSPDEQLPEDCPSPEPSESATGEPG